MNSSVSEENYLKAIFKLTYIAGNEFAGTNDLSAILNHKAGSITEMLNKLHVKKLIDYKKYHGVKLTKKGYLSAVKIIRKHRLWEVFLVNTLGFKWDEVHDIAEQMEHIENDELTNRLDSFLNFPKADPHGDPIPDEHGKFNEIIKDTLVNGRPKKKYEFTGVKSHTKEFLNHLSDIGFSIGDKLEIKHISEFDKSIELKIVNKRKSVFIGSKTAMNMLVKAI